MDSTTATSITIQPAQPGLVVGQYDVHQPLPYPYHILPDELVDRQDWWNGSPHRLAGFQRNLDVQEVAVFAFQWVPVVLSGATTARDEVIGMYPVFIDRDGGMWTDTRPVDAVRVNVPAVTA